MKEKIMVYRIYIIYAHKNIMFFILCMQNYDYDYCLSCFLGQQHFTIQTFCHLYLSSMSINVKIVKTEMALLMGTFFLLLYRLVGTQNQLIRHKRL